MPQNVQSLQVEKMEELILDSGPNLIHFKIKLIYPWSMPHPSTKFNENQSTTFFSNLVARQTNEPTKVKTLPTCSAEVITDVLTNQTFC